jgi:spermidine/putrescine transport system permease protein
MSSSTAIILTSRRAGASLGLAIGAFIVALAGAGAVFLGLINLGSLNSFGLVAGGALVFVTCALWGARLMYRATGVSAGQQSLLATTILVFTFFYLPILALIVFSFNSGRVITTWEGFSLQWYVALVEDEKILAAFRNTMVVTFASTIISTIIGTMVSVAMERYNFRLKLPFDAVLYMPIIIPDIVIALATLLFFNLIAFRLVGALLGLQWGLGLSTIIISHVAFNISFVATVVRARLVDMDPTLEQAAQDLGANEWQTFRRITLPLLMPGVISGALLAFTLSLDDYVITSFVSGPGSTTLPILVYSKVKFGVTPDLNALATLLLVFSIGLVLLSQLLQRRG